MERSEKGPKGGHVCALSRRIAGLFNEKERKQGAVWDMCSRYTFRGSRKRGTVRRAPTIPFPLILLVRPHLLRPTSRWKAWVGRNRNFDFDPIWAFTTPSQGECHKRVGWESVAHPTVSAGYREQARRLSWKEIGAIEMTG